MVRQVRVDLIEPLAEREVVLVEVGEEGCRGGDHARLKHGADEKD